MFAGFVPRILLSKPSASIRRDPDRVLPALADASPRRTILGSVLLETEGDDVVVVVVGGVFGLRFVMRTG